MNEAGTKLDKVIQEVQLNELIRETSRKKKEIVIEHAERLEKLIPQTATISSTIVKRLKGKVGKSLIHKYLSPEYKKESGRNSALMQKKEAHLA